ncbi:HAMP domain-containing histidine kinase [Olivibacter sp. SDN3]|uniref:HAMP domain-containing sensor histidine kinase n=1 Tax=Olivibacter sp. SDN3 TaxID=2764720 RepID=UPI0016514E3C|nr:HAMP domain-containing sensor histidine kinase [Olivibacter sp. SDN3]QNL51434.1 HAMP domain-containing histidine kinase [Olivibacter sp. SDN3]
MTIRLKLAWNSTLIVAAVLGFTFLGTYLFFEQHVRQSFYKRLQSSALTAAFFHLEKDELNDQKYQIIEQRYQEIHDESIRFFDENNRMVFEDDTLDYRIDADILERIRRKQITYFDIGERQFSGIFYQDNEGNYVVLASAVDADGYSQLKRLRLYLLLFYALGVGLSFILTNLLAKQTFKPFARLIRNVNTISATNLHERLETSDTERDELTELRESFNLFLDRLESGVKSQQNFLKHASHELKTPLASIIGNLEVTLSKHRSNAEYVEKMRALHNDALHIKAILEGLLLLSGLEASKNISLMKLRIDELLWDLLEKIGIHHPEAIVRIDLEEMRNKPALLEVLANRELLLIAIGNLIDNALKFSNNQPVLIKLYEDEERLCLTIKDKGIGIEAADQQDIFNLFYRGAKSAAIPGHGIGLYLGKQVLDLHGITLDVSSTPDIGTTFYLFFPKFHL